MTTTAIRRTLISGASRGLGQGLAARLTELGHPVVATSRSGAEGEQLDVADENSVKTLGARLTAKGTRLGALVNNAAIYLREGGPDAPKRTLATNVFGMMQLTRVLLPLIDDGGRIVNVSSGMGELRGYSPALTERLRGARGEEDVRRLASEYLDATARGGYDGAERAGFVRDAYSVSKALVNAFTRALALELTPRHITVVSVCPGWVQTDMGGSSAPRPLARGVDSIAAALLDPVESGAFYRDGRTLDF